MTPKDLAAVDEFLKITSKPDLVDYLGIAATTDDAQVVKVLEDKRRWAQGQQANPKFRSEALWLIKHQEILKRVLVENRSHYVRLVETKKVEGALATVEQFARGALGDRVLTPDKEKNILARASELEVPAERARQFLDELVHLLGVERRSDFETNRIGAFVDYYQMLEASPDAPALVLEEAFRARYRQAEELLSEHEQKQLRDNLDKAYKVLRNKEQRARYDAARTKALGVVLQSSTGLNITPIPGLLSVDEVQGFLPSPVPEIVDPNPVFGLQKGAADRILPPEPPPPTEGSPKIQSPRLEGPRIDGLRLGQGRGSTPTDPLSVPGSLTVDSDGPRLQLVGEKKRDVSVGWEPARFTVEVSNAGTKPMKGKVSSPWSWLEVRPEYFFDVEPAAVMSFTVVVFPRLMPARTATAQIGITTEHGEKRSLEVVARRPFMSAPVRNAAMGVFVTLLLILAWSLTR